VRELLQELGSFGALPMLQPSSHLDRELGLGSLERVELLARLESEFGVVLPDRAAAEANTPDDLARAILEAPQENSGDENTFSALRASVTRKEHIAKRRKPGLLPRKR
jgi:acyl carrier protein